MFRGNLAVRAVAAVFAVLSLIETILGAPAAVSALADIGIGGSKYLGPILGAVLVVIFGLIAVGPERVSAWVGRLSRGPSDHLPEAVREDDDEPLTLLEAWLEQRIREQRTLARQRAVRGDSWYFAAMGQWDADNVEGLHQGLAPELVARYREHPQDPGHVDGVPPPHGRQEREDYFGRRLDWLERTLRELRTGQREPTPADREVPEAHRVELQEIAAGLMESISLERRASYHPPRRAGTQPVAQSFRVHFPPVARMLDEWDALVAEADAARKAVVDWATAEAQARAEAAGLTVYGPIGYIAADLVERNQTPVGFRWHEADGWLSLAGSAIVQVSPGDDPEKLRRPFDELLVDAFATDDGATLRKLRVRLDNAKAQIAEALERLKVMHVIHGQCDLCR